MIRPTMAVMRDHNKLHQYFESNFSATRCSASILAEEKSVLVELELPSSRVAALEASIKDASLQSQINKLAGGSWGTKIARFTVLPAQAKPTVRNRLFQTNPPFFAESCERND